MKQFKYAFAEHFRAARWCLAAAVCAFTAAVSIYKYVDLSDMAAIAFSSPETLYLVLSDSMNIIFIYLPLYLFIVCGTADDSFFGASGLLKQGGRSNWLINKFFILLADTLLFFLMILLINLTVASRVFPFSESWSSGFIAFRSSMGYSGLDFRYPPVNTLIISVSVLFLLYLLSGLITLLVSLLTDKEEPSLLFALLSGIAFSLVNMNISSNDAASQLIRVLVISGAILILSAACRVIAKRKDFNFK